MSAKLGQTNSVTANSITIFLLVQICTVRLMIVCNRPYARRLNSTKVKYVIAALAIGEVVEAQKTPKRRGGAFKNGKKPTRAARKAARQQALKPSSSIRVASNAAEIYSDDSEARV